MDDGMYEFRIGATATSSRPSTRLCTRRTRTTEDRAPQQLPDVGGVHVPKASLEPVVATM